MNVANVLHTAMWIVKTVKNFLLEESITLLISPASFSMNMNMNRQRHLALKTQIMTALTTCPVSIL